VATAGEVWASGAVEGPTDEAVLRRIASHVGLHIGAVHGKNGKQHLRQQIPGYNKAARIVPWVVLVDLDHEANAPHPCGHSG